MSSKISSSYLSPSRRGEVVFDDSEEEGNHVVAEQLDRVRTTSHVERAGDGGITVTYTADDGAPRTVSSRQNIGDKAASNKISSDKKFRVAMIALFSAMGSTLFGLDIGYIGPIIECISFKGDVAHITAHEHVDPAVEGMIVSLFSIGAMCTAFPLVSSYFLDNWGRKSSIMAGALVFILGSLVQGTATSQTQLLIGRFVAGMSIGLLSTVIVLYQSEVAPANMRGALSTLYQLGITFGILIAAFIDQFLVERNEGWRAVMAIICIPALFLLVGMTFLPRSPRWLVQQGRRKEALKVLLTIRSEAEAIQEELEIFDEVQKSKLEGDPDWSELMQGRQFRLVVLGVVLQLLQQLVGMNAFMYFGPKIFEAIGFSKNVFTTINNFVNFLSTFPAVILADIAGRRVLMLSSAIGMTLACVVMGIVGLMSVTKISDPANPGEEVFHVASSNAGWVIAISAFFFVFNFAYGFGPLVWVYCSEIFPLRYRTRCVGVCTMANWVGNFIIAQFTPMLLDGIQFSTFFVFGAFCIISVLVAAWMPETKNVPLELIQELFDEKAFFRSTAEKRKDAGTSSSSDNSDSN